METVSKSALDFLLAKLDADREQAGEKYLALLDELANYLRVKNCFDSRLAAEDALDRVARKIAGGEDVLNIRAYAFRVAKFVLLENLRKVRPAEFPEDYENRFAAPESQSDFRLECLEECLKTLDALDREIIVNWYQGEGKEKATLKTALGAKLNLSMTAMKLRAMRARQRLEKCINDCVRKKL